MLDIIKPFHLIYEEQQTRSVCFFVFLHLLGLGRLGSLLCQCLVLLLVHVIMAHRSQSVCV